MSKTAWVKSLLIPVLTAVASIVLVKTGVGVSGNHEFTPIFGLFLSGLLPVILVAALKIDLSKYFSAKMILLALTAVVYVFEFTPFVIFLVLLIDPLGIIGYFILPIVLLIAEVIYALKKGENLKTKACLLLSSPVLVILGLLLDCCINLG